MKELLYKMFGHKSLSKEEAKQVLLNISDGRYNDSQLSAFMTVFLMRSITTEELAGFREAILERRVIVDLDCHDAIDIVGTGGDGKNTFNISTVAGAGYRVVKHGNYGASSVSGASNVLEQHGVKFTGHSGRLQQSLEESGVAYLHAPFFSPALKSVDLGTTCFRSTYLFQYARSVGKPCHTAISVTWSLQPPVAPSVHIYLSGERHPLCRCT